MREDGRIPVIRDDVSTSASESAIFKSNAYGFMRSMEKEGIEISRNSFFCFGAGKTGAEMGGEFAALAVVDERRDFIGLGVVIRLVVSVHLLLVGAPDAQLDFVGQIVVWRDSERIFLVGLVLVVGVRIIFVERCGSCPTYRIFH